MRLQLSLILIALMLCAIAMQSTSKYEGVSWNSKKTLWQSELYINGKKRKSYFGNEFDAAKHLNKFCEKMGMPLQNPNICAIPNQQAKEKTSQYKGVSYNKYNGKWNARKSPKGQKQKYGGSFNDELDAAKRVNHLCVEFGIPLLHPKLSTIPNQQYQFKEKWSQYKGVTYDKQTCKWKVCVYIKGEKQTYGGQFNDELDAGKRVNQLCEELGIPQKNLTISAMPNQQHNTIEKTSQYKGVCYHKQTDKWYVKLSFKGFKNQYFSI